MFWQRFEASEGANHTALLGKYLPDSGHSGRTLRSIVVGGDGRRLRRVQIVWTKKETLILF